jgi:hypothetical protein
MNFFKPIKMVDWLMIVVAIVLFSTMDYGNMNFVDKAYVVCVAIWVVLLGGRLYIEYQKRNRCEK